MQPMVLHGGRPVRQSPRRRVLIVAFAAIWSAQRTGSPQPVAPLPAGVRAVWEPEKAYREATPTRERICINGLWRWQPAESDAGTVPAGAWGHFKVPGCWPGITDYMQKDSQVVQAHPEWAGRDLRRLSAAWYQREITIPAAWSGRGIALAAEYLNSFAAVYVGGEKVGEMRFPAGEVDLGAVCRPGRTYLLSLLVVALPLDGVRLSYTDTAAARAAKGSVNRRGLCGDVYLDSSPTGPRIRDVKIDPSVREWRLTLDVALDGLSADPDRSYRLRARVTDGGRTVKEILGDPFTARALEGGRVRIAAAWKPDRLWDLHTPGNLYEAAVSLLDPEGRVLDAFHPARFGFRELWIEGRDFILNGSRIFLAAVPLDNAQIGAALASYAGARESLERLKSVGINLVYTHNYDCEPGSHLSFTEILRAADDVGMLVSFTQPHFSHYRWEDSGGAGGDAAGNDYARHAAFYVRAAQNHPSVVLYAMSHNATGYSDDMNPDRIDGIDQPRDTWALNNSRRALRAEAIVRRLDPSRIVYHHASGNLSSMHTSNFYANFVPSQELCDWFEHWATRGVKPVFLCEFGAPLSWDWTMYRGWYKGEREFGSAQVPWEFCLAEWNAQFLGDRAYRLSENEKSNLRWEARQFREGRLWHRWDYPHAVGSNDFDERQPVYAEYFTDVWRALRGWGVSAVCPWDHGHYWKLRAGVNRERRPLAVDWENLQRPGFSPDAIGAQYERFDLAFERSDWTPAMAGEALVRANRPLLAFIGGKAARFTGKDHNFSGGETVEKQLIVINNSRRAVGAGCRWSFALPEPLAGMKELQVETGQQVRLPLRFDLPGDLAPGAYDLKASVDFGGGEIQEDSFTIHILPPAPAMTAAPIGAIALFDPRGETAAWLRRLGVAAHAVDAGADLSQYAILVVGKGALNEDGPAPDIGRVREGQKVIIFEQTAGVLERRFGFRVAEYGLRRVFERLPGHAALAGLHPQNLRDWRGEATILPPRLDCEMRPRYGPTVRWCDIPVTRLWRCGCYGNVASVLIEKPACGDFLPLLDGGYGLQYSPLLEYREGQGMVLFCQMDVTGRTESDPAADRLAMNILEYVKAWKPGARRGIVYVGEPAGKRHLEASGFAPEPLAGALPARGQVLIAGPGSGEELARHRASMAGWLDGGGRLLAVGLDGQEASALLPFAVRTETREHIAAFFEPQRAPSPFAGIGPADLHNRDPRELPHLAAGAEAIGGGMLASAGEGKVIFCQLAPWRFGTEPQNVKRVYRRASFALARLLGNLGAAGATPLLERFGEPARGEAEKRWLTGLYLDRPEEWDDPYRFFRW